MFYMVQWSGADCCGDYNEERVFTSLERAEAFYATTITKDSVEEAVLSKAEETAKYGIRPTFCIKEWERWGRKEED